MAFAHSRIHELQPQRTGFGVVLRLVAALTVSAFCLGLLLSWAPPQRVAEAFHALRPAWLAAALLAVGIACGLRARRWAAMLRSAGAEVRFRDAAVPVMGAAALDNLLPLGAGEAIRLIALQSFAERPNPRLVGTLGLEKRLDLAAALAILLVSLMAWPQAAGAPRLIPPPGVLAAALFAVIAWATVAAAARERTPGRGGARLALLLGLSLAVVLAEALVFFAAGRALGLAHALPAAGAAAGLTGVARKAPAPPAQIGLFEGLAAAAVWAIAAPPAEAVAYAILSHALFWIPVTATGWWLLVGAARIGVARGPLITGLAR